MNKVYNLTVNGQKNLINADGILYFAWSLSDCSKQIEFTLNIYDGEAIVYKRQERAPLQVCIVEDLKLIPLKEYSFEVFVKTDAYEELSKRENFVATTKDFGNARWISQGSFYVSETKELGSPAHYFRKVFTVDKLAKRSVIHICGLGLYELFLNGKRVGDRVLEPAFTAYHKRVLYSSYDVSDMLKLGENIVEVTLGDGWYNQTSIDTWGFYRAPWRDCAKMIFSLICDGKEMVVSNTSWEVSLGELTKNTLRVGEEYDFTKQREYHGAFLATPPGGALTPSYLPPIRECEELLPISVTDYGEYKLYDFGKNIAGYCYAKLNAKQGDFAHFEYGERVENGKVDNKDNSKYVSNASLCQVDECKLKDGVNEYKPKFTYHGFRYLAVYTNAEIVEVKALFVHTDLPKLGEFNSSNETLNTLYSMSINAILSNYHGFPTDCPQREKNGWTGDAQLSIEPSIYNFDMQFAYKKWLDDFIDNQLPSGQISAIIPTSGWGFNWGSGPAWDIAFFRIPYALKRYYGDTFAVKQIYPYLERYFAYMSKYLQNNLIEVGLGDWNYPRNEEFDICPLELVASACYKQMADILADFSQIVNDENVEKYRNVSKAVGDAILQKYKDEKSLTGLATLDYIGVADRKNEICEYLEKNNYAVHFGIIGNKYIFDVLRRSNRADIALKVLERTEYPSFGEWAIKGQTALCEEFELTSSLNHHMYSPIIEYMINGFCGLIITGVNTFELKPNLPKGLGFVEYSYKTANGKIAVNVTKNRGKTSILLEVPANCAVFYNGKEYLHGKYKI